MQLRKTFVAVSYLVFAMTVAGIGNIYAQSCSDENIDVAALLQDARKNKKSSQVYDIAAVAGENAMDELRKSAYVKEFDYVNAHAKIALAKLGDDAALKDFKDDFKDGFEKGGTFSTYSFNLLLKAVGDERAIRIVMEHFVENQDQVTPMIHIIAQGMRVIAAKRHVPEMPLYVVRERSAKENVDEWVQWWERNKDAPVGRPVYESVDNPYLRCLARKVEWGTPGAFRSIADYGGAEAEATLRKFPRPASAYYPLGEFHGDLNSALAKMGDQHEFDGIVDDLRTRPGSGNPIAKLRYIGDKRAVKALIDALDVTYDEKVAKAQYKAILDTLVKMIQNAPLGYGAEPTENNFNIWKEWWETKRDIAVIIPYNRQQR